MANGQNGGRWALAGFLYQIVAMLSMVARASEPPEISNDEDEIMADSLVMLPNVGEEIQAHHERFEDVAFIGPDDECVLVQMKYSSTGRRISVGEARAITSKLHASFQEAIRQNYQVTTCVLFTNRQLTTVGGGATEYWEREKQTRPYRLRHELVSMDDLMDELEGFGKRYGMFDREIDAGIDRLIGRVFRDAVGTFDASFGMPEFLEHFIGSRDANQLTEEYIKQRSSQRLEELGRWIGIACWDGSPVQRETQQDIVNAIHEKRALIALCGPGGCGKSTLVWQVLNSVRCRMFVHADEILDSWVENEVHSWRGLAHNSTDNRQRAIERISVANPSSPRPILWLGLDGIDEGNLCPERENHIREILRWFWQSDQNRREETPLATLIVTARKTDRLFDFLRLNWGPRTSPQQLLVFRISFFTNRERDTAAQKKAPGIHQRLYRFNRQHDLLGWQDDIEILGGEIPDENLESIDEAVWDSLKHPAMWQAYLALEPEIRRLAIEGSAEAKHQVAHGFLQWFGRKLRLRLGNRVEELVRNDYRGLLEILVTIAMHSNIDALNQRDGEWVEHARRTPIGISRREAEDLYIESLSAGLIDEYSPRHWRWRHSLVYDYLMSCGRGG
jgi:hypothetical protein